MKLHIIFLCLLLIIILIILITYHHNKQIYTSYPLDECILPLDNPCRGFYHLYQYQLNSDTVAIEQLAQKHSLWNEEERLALLEINLNLYSSCDITTEALSCLSSLLSAWSTSNKKLILRFLYDWEGKAYKTEPKTVKQVIQHMDQVAPIINQYKEHIYLLQGVFVGDYGEMHDSVLLTEDTIPLYIKHLASVLDSSIFLAVRTPAQLRLVTTEEKHFNNSTPYNCSLMSRVGLFNDGMLGSVSDLGTYHGSVNNINLERKMEIDYQDRKCLNVPNGGEVVIDNEYNELSFAIRDMSKMHVTYLNSTYDTSVLNKWRDSFYGNTDRYQGLNGLDYIKLHLGYRFRLCNFFVMSKGIKKRKLFITITMANDGFAAPNFIIESYLILQGTKSKAVHRFLLPIDLYSISNHQQTRGRLIILRSELSEPCYHVYLLLSDKQSQEHIQLANTLSFTDIGYSLGEINF